MLELLVSMVLGSALVATMILVLATSHQLNQGLLQQIQVQERVGILSNLWPRLLAGAGHMGCLSDTNAVVNFLNTQWSDLGLLKPWPAVEIVVSPQDSPLFSAIKNLAPDSHALVVRGFSEPLGKLAQALDSPRGVANLFHSRTRISPKDSVLLTDCQQGSLFSATKTRHSRGMVHFSWATGDDPMSNRATGRTVHGLIARGRLALKEDGFAEGARLYGPTSFRLYVAESRLSSARAKVYALWQKPLNGNAIELVSGVNRLALGYGAWRADGGGQIGYFNADQLPVDAEVMLLSVHLTIAPAIFAPLSNEQVIRLAIPLSSVAEG